MSAARATRLSIVALSALASSQAERHVVAHRHVRIQRVVLEHHRDVALFRQHVVDDASADRDLAGADLLEPGDHPQQRRLAAAGRADQHRELAVGDVDVDAVDDVRRAKVLFDATYRDLRHQRLSPLLHN